MNYNTTDWPALPPLSTLVNKVHCMDCLEFMALLPDHSIHAIITDLPYQVTSLKWDEIIPFAPMWAAVKRILKPRGVFVTTATEPFASLLRVSNLKWFKYDWVWDKHKATNHVNASKQPLRVHENVCVFSEDNSNYFPQLKIGEPYKGTARKVTNNGHGKVLSFRKDNEGIRYPKSIVNFSFEMHPVHPTQKPVELYEYLVRTYTQPGELVLDITAGSGTTGVACVKTGRDFILVDSSPEYCDIAHKRIHAGFVTVDVAEGVKQPSLFELAG